MQQEIEKIKAEYATREAQREIERREKCVALKTATEVYVQFGYEETGKWEKIHSIHFSVTDENFIRSVTTKVYGRFENHLLHNIKDWR